MLRTRLTTKMWVDSLKIPQIVVFVWDQTAFLSVFREGKHPFGLQRKSQHFPSSVFTINHWSASRESSLALNQHFRVFSISAIPGRWQSKCDWQEKWKKQRQNRGCCQQALGGGNKSVQRMEGCRARPVLIIPKACQVLTLWQGSLEPSDGFPAPLIILGAVGRFLIPECKSLMWFCKQPVFAANSYADSLSHEIQEKNIGRPAAFAIRTSELALSFNPGFRWVSPIYSTNPHWNVALAEIWIYSSGQQSGLKKQMNKANHHQFGNHRYKKADGCWLHRGEDEDKDGMETPSRQLHVSESRTTEETATHRRWDHLQ